MRSYAKRAVSPSVAEVASPTTTTSDTRADYDPAELRPMSVIASTWPAKTRGIHVGQGYRYRDPGVAGVTLRCVYVPGSGWCSCARWVLRFIQDVNQARAARETAAPAPRTHRRRLLRDTLLPGGSAS